MDIGKGVADWNFQIPKFYFIEIDDITHIIIGVLLVPTSELILQKIVLFIEKLIYSERVKIDNLERSQKMKIRDFMKGFTKLIEDFLHHDEVPILLKVLDGKILKITRD